MFRSLKRLMIRLGSLPVIAIALSLIAVAIHVHDPLRSWLVYDRSAIAAGEPWRHLTGHLTHWNADHLLWDVLMFLTLGIMLESRNRAGFVTTLVSSAAAISAMVWFWQPEISEYRGLSGIDSALFVHVAVMLRRDAIRSGRLHLRQVVSAAILGFIAKVAYELVTGNTLFVDSAAAGFIPLATTHAMGGLVGGFVGSVQAEFLRQTNFDSKPRRQDAYFEVVDTASAGAEHLAIGVDGKRGRRMHM